MPRGREVSRGLTNIAAVGAASGLLASAPIATSALTANCDRLDVICEPQVPNRPDNHDEHSAVPFGTGSSVAMGTGTVTGSPDPDPPWTSDMDALLYPDFIGQVLRAYITTGAQEGPGLW
jgi:hypothetical protein